MGRMDSGLAVVVLCALASCWTCAPAAELPVEAEANTFSTPCYIPQDAGGLVAAAFEVTTQCCPGKYLYIANVLDRYTHIHLCTGVLLAGDQVAVPAQCVLKKTADGPGPQIYFPVVRMGSKNLNKHEEAGEEEVLEVSQIAVHSGFNGDETHGFDVALLTLSQPSAAPPLTSIVPADKCKEGLSLLGWLAPSVQGAPSVNLTAVHKMEYKLREECDTAMGGMPPNATCAASPITQALSWDLGALLLCDDKHLVGLLSYKKPGQGRHPYVFTHLSEYRPWLNGRGSAISRVFPNARQNPPHDEL